jgi:hypothetical protein
VREAEIYLETLSLAAMPSPVQEHPSIPKFAGSQMANEGVS